jgi:chromosome segregation ATPase
MYPTNPSKERVKICFDILNLLSDEVGPLSSVLKIITKELNEAMYSQTYTSSQEDPYYEKLPYCVLVDRLNKARESEEVKLKQELEELKRKLAFKDDDLQLVLRKNLHLKRKVEEYEHKSDRLQDELKRKEKALAEKDNELKNSKASHKIESEKLQKEKQMLEVKDINQGSK